MKHSEVKIVQDIAKIRAKRVLLIQTSLTILLALLSLIIFYPNAACSALLGGATTIIPALIFMNRAFTHKGAQAAGKIVGDFYLGEALKFIVMGLLFFVIFRFLHPNGLVFMLSFILTQVAALFVPHPSKEAP